MLGPCSKCGVSPVNLPVSPQIAFTPAAALASAEIDRFRDQGFLVVPQLCDGVELAGIASVLRTLFARQTGRAEGNQLDMLGADRDPHGAVQPQIVKPSVYAPRLLRTRLHAAAAAVARQLLGPQAQFSFDHSILKPAGSAAATPWHQDEAHHADQHFRHPQVSIWVPLQDVNEVNGCMRYVPGSHRGGLLPHRPAGGNPGIHALECISGFDEADAVSCPVPAGWAVLHEGRTLHGALPNHGDAERLAYVMVFRAPPEPRIEALKPDWLAQQRTARLERNQQWRRNGGFALLLGRWMRRALQSDLTSLVRKVGSRALRARPAASSAVTPRSAPPA